MEDPVKITFTAYGNIQTATAEGLKSHEYEAGETVTVSDDLAVMFIQSGVAIPATSGKPTKATFKEDARDGDGDGLVQDGTEFERPAKAVKAKGEKATK